MNLKWAKIYVHNFYALKFIQSYKSCSHVFIYAGAKCTAHIVIMMWCLIYFFVKQSTYFYSEFNKISFLGYLDPEYICNAAPENCFVINGLNQTYFHYTHLNIYIYECIHGIPWMCFLLHSLFID